MLGVGGKYEFANNKNALEQSFYALRAYALVATNDRWGVWPVRRNHLGVGWKPSRTAEAREGKKERFFVPPRKLWYTGSGVPQSSMPLRKGQ